jgi:hypothetical protein
MRKTFQNLPLEKIPFGSPEFRDYFRSQLVNNYPNGNLYLFVYVGCLAGVIVFLSCLLSGVSRLELATLPLYLLFCNLFEYIFHRYPMHHKVKGLSSVYQHVTVHHNFYGKKAYFEEDKDYYAVIIPYYILSYVIISSVFAFVLLYIIIGFNQAALFLIAVYSYYLAYELLHFSYHAPEHSWLKKIPMVKTLARFHLTHHKTELMAKYNFNITFPVFDFLFGTAHRENCVSNTKSFRGHRM